MAECFDHSSVHPSFRPASLRPNPCRSVLASLPSVFTPVTIPPCLPPSSVPQLLPHFRRLFLCPCLFPVSPCLLPSVSRFPLPFLPPLRSCLSLSSFSLFVPDSLPLSLLNKLTYDISLAHWCDFGFFFCFNNYPYFISFSQRHDAKNGKTDEGWRMKSCPLRWFYYDCFSCICFSCIYNCNIKSATT